METNNKIIAEFMGATLTKDLQIMYPVYEGDSSYVKDLKYHLDWNWLMEVVEKIESLLPDDSFVTIEYKSCWIPIYDDEQPFGIECREETKTQAVYNACIEFIKWYNENSAKEK